MTEIAPDLTGRQKRELRARGRTMPDSARIDKGGIDDTFVRHVASLFERTDLIKVRFAAGEGSARKAIATEAARATGSQYITIVGRTMLLYRPLPPQV